MDYTNSLTIDIPAEISHSSSMTSVLPSIEETLVSTPIDERLPADHPLHKDQVGKLPVFAEQICWLVIAHFTSFFVTYI